MTDPIRFMETTYKGVFIDEHERRRPFETVAIWAYTSPAVLEQDLKLYFGETDAARLQQKRISPHDAYRAEHWGGEGHKLWMKYRSGDCFACNLGPYVFPDMTPQKT